MLLVEAFFLPLEHEKTMHFLTHPPTSLLVVKYPQEKMFHSKPAPWLTASLKKLGIIYLFCCDSLTKFAPRKKHLSSVAGPTSNLNTRSLSLSLGLGHSAHHVTARRLTKAKEWHYLLHNNNSIKKKLWRVPSLARWFFLTHVKAGEGTSIWEWFR